MTIYFLKPLSRHGRDLHPRHPERSVFGRIPLNYFDRFLFTYESRLEKEYCFFLPVIKKVVELYLDCGNPRCGFAHLTSLHCAEERLLMFSCRTRGFYSSFDSKRLEKWGEWMRETLLLDVPHRQVVFTNPKMLRLFFKLNHRPPGKLCRQDLRSLISFSNILFDSRGISSLLSSQTIAKST